MLCGVVVPTAAQTEEEDGNQLSGQVSDGSVAGNAASSQSLVIGREGRGRLPRRDQLHGPEPDLAAPETVAAVAEAMLRDGRPGFARFRVPAQQLPELPVVAKGVHITDRGEQDRLAHVAHEGKAVEHRSLPCRPALKRRDNRTLDVLDLLIDGIELPEQPALGVQDGLDISQTGRLGRQAAELLDPSGIDPDSALHHKHPINVVRRSGRQEPGCWEGLEEFAHSWTGDAALEELFEFGEQGVLDVGELEPKYECAAR